MYIYITNNYWNQNGYEINNPLGNNPRISGELYNFM
jgi:hypothetical protein